MPTTPPRLVTVRPTLDPDTGPRHVVAIAGIDGPAFVTLAIADLYADQLEAALAPDAAAGARARALRAQPESLDALIGRTASPRSALLRALRWICEGDGEPPSTLRTGDAVGGEMLDRLGGEMAVACGEDVE